MPSSDAPSNHLSPHRPIRRFDVFAEYTRLERLARGDATDVAKGYGIWLAKVNVYGDEDWREQFAGMNTAAPFGEREETRSWRR